MRILDRYLGASFLRLFVLFVLASPLTMILFDLTDRLDTYLSRGIGLSDVIRIYVLQLPLFILWAFPVAALIATVFTVNGMARHSEIAAAKAGGISFYRLILPVPLLGIVLTFAALGLSELVPVTNRMRAEALGQDASVRRSRSDFVYRGEDGRVFAIRYLDVENGRMSGVAMEREGNEPAVPGVHMVASTARFEPDRGWIFEDGLLRLFAGAGRERMFRFDSLATPGFDDRPEELLAQPKDPDEMRYRELQRFIEVLERSGGRPLELRVELAQKVAVPVATLVIILFAAPLAMSAPRSGAAYGIGVSLGITIIYLMMFKVTGAAGATGALDPVLSAWLPNAVFALAAAALLTRVRT